MQLLGLHLCFFFSPFKASLPQEMPVASHPVRALGGSGPANRPTGPSYERLAVATLTLCRQSSKTRQRREQEVRFDSKTSGKMLQRAASNVSDKAKSSKPKVGQQFEGNICLFFPGFLFFFLPFSKGGLSFMESLLLLPPVDALHLVILHPSCF